MFMIKFLFGIIIASIIIIFAPEIKDFFITSGFRDYLVEWLESWSESNNLLTEVPGDQK